jgi:hypothetical protein
MGIVTRKKKLSYKKRFIRSRDQVIQNETDLANWTQRADSYRSIGTHTMDIIELFTFRKLVHTSR